MILTTTLLLAFAQKDDNHPADPRRSFEELAAECEKARAERLEPYEADLVVRLEEPDEEFVKTYTGTLRFLPPGKKSPESARLYMELHETGGARRAAFRIWHDGESLTIADDRPVRDRHGESILTYQRFAVRRDDPATWRPESYLYHLLVPALDNAYRPTVLMDADAAPVAPQRSLEQIVRDSNPGLTEEEVKREVERLTRETSASAPSWHVVLLNARRQRDDVRSIQLQMEPERFLVRWVEVRHGDGVKRSFQIDEPRTTIENPDSFRDSFEPKLDGYRLVE